MQWRKGPAENLPFEDGALFHFFDQPAALREFCKVLAGGGLLAVATLSRRQPLPLHRLSANRLNPVHNPSPAEVRALFEGAGFRVSEQHRVRRPGWTRVLPDLITVGIKRNKSGQPAEQRAQDSLDRVRRRWRICRFRWRRRRCGWRSDWCRRCRERRGGFRRLRRWRHRKRDHRWRTR